MTRADVITQLSTICSAADLLFFEILGLSYFRKRHIFKSLINVSCFFKIGRAITDATLKCMRFFDENVKSKSLSAKRKKNL